MFIFYKIRNYFSKQTLLNFYYGLFSSIATYGLIAWGSAYENAINSILSFQKRLLKIILGKNFRTKNLNLVIPLTIRQNYCLLALLRHYDELIPIQLITVIVQEAREWAFFRNLLVWSAHRAPLQCISIWERQLA